MPYFMRGLLAVALMLCGLLFWPLFAVGCLIAWTVYSDIRDEPERKRQEAEVKARLNEPIAVADMRLTCESPAEEAFFDAMVSAYNLKAGPGCLAGNGIRLKTQIGLGQLRIGRSTVWSEFRGDFLVDDKLVVEIDGAKWHGSPEAKARDAQRDKAIQAEGYTVLRIPASVVFNDPDEAVRRVDEARVGLAIEDIVDPELKDKKSPTLQQGTVRPLPGENDALSGTKDAISLISEIFGAHKERLEANAELSFQLFALRSTVVRALHIAENQLEIDQKFEQNPKLRKHAEMHEARVSELFGRMKKKAGQDESEKLVLSGVSLLPVSKDILPASAIEERKQQIQEAKEALSLASSRLNRSPSLLAALPSNLSEPLLPFLATQMEILEGHLRGLASDLAPSTASEAGQAATDQAQIRQPKLEKWQAQTEEQAFGRSPDWLPKS